MQPETAKAHRAVLASRAVFLSLWERSRAAARGLPAETFGCPLPEGEGFSGRQAESAKTRHDVGDCRGEDCLGQTKPANEHEARQQAPDDRTGGVRRVQQADRPRVTARPVDLALRVAHAANGQRQRGAHERRGHQQHGKRQDSPHAAGDQRRLRRRDHLRQVGIRALQQAERPRRQERGQRDAELNQAVHAQRPPRPIRAAAADEAANGQAAHEGGQHRADGKDRHPERQPEQPHPGDLVHEPRRPREEQQDDERVRDRLNVLRLERFARQLGPRSAPTRDASRATRNCTHSFTSGFGVPFAGGTGTVGASRARRRCIRSLIF